MSRYQELMTQEVLNAMFSAKRVIDSGQSSIATIVTGYGIRLARVFKYGKDGKVEVFTAPAGSMWKAVNEVWDQRDELFGVDRLKNHASETGDITWYLVGSHHRSTGDRFIERAFGGKR